MGAMYRGQGRHGGGQAIQSAIVCDVAVGGGGGGGHVGGHHFVKTTNYQKKGGGTGHQMCECCLKVTQLGQVTLSVWKRRTSKGSAC